eukprot:TRINITY_DN9899_c0_g1_i2.p2 TRINITY_DN9899_c0_g1~~TRINITY_DN9899_c0_g1_i2.p2  ORF type:complete len:106 (-),score=14.81 TRINITY_DN9899_c0_g1_i2:113-430(-)
MGKPPGVPRKHVEKIEFDQFEDLPDEIFAGSSVTKNSGDESMVGRVRASSAKQEFPSLPSYAKPSELDEPNELAGTLVRGHGPIWAHPDNLDYDYSRHTSARNKH